MPRSTVTFSYSGIGEMLRSQFMLDEMERRATKIEQYARDTAPVGNPKRDAHSGRYRDSFSIDLTHNGGWKNDRACATVVNNSPEAVFVEFGTSRQQAHHTLRTALHAAVD